MIMLSTRTSIFLGGALLVYAIGRTFAGDQVATFTQIEGDVKVFSHPSKSPPTHTPSKNSGFPHALFEGEYFEVKPASLGDPVEQGNIVRTAPNAKARVVYPNGDQINVGPGTAYRTFWKDTRPHQQPEWNLMYGKVRGIIEKGGPRTTLRVRTRTAVMGVRGTDFYVGDQGTKGATEVSILRGAVELKPLNVKAPSTTVESGYSATIAPPAAPVLLTSPVAPPAAVEVRKTTQEDLASIQKNSQIRKSQETPTQVAPQLQALEAKASQTVLKDIQLHDAQLYATLAKNPAATAEDLNRASVLHVMKDAPKAPPPTKPTQSDFENIEKNPYDKYFKPSEE